MHKEEMNQHSGFSFKPIIALSVMITLGIIMSYNELPGLPFTIPGSGFLIAHILYSVFKRKPKGIVTFLSLSAIIVILSLIVFFIEAVDYLNYFAFLVCLFSAASWLTGEALFWIIVNMKKKTTS